MQTDNVHQLEREDRVERNPGCALELDWVKAVRVNRSAAERRAATLTTRRSIKRDAQAAWLLRAVTCIDLTTLGVGFDPRGLAVDPVGNVLFCDRGNAVVRRIDTAGNISTFAGTGGTTGNAGDGGPRRLPAAPGPLSG